MSVRNIIRKTLSRLSTQPEVGGIQVTDSSIQYVLIRKKQITHAAVRLPEGVIQEGLVKDPEGLKTALAHVHNIAAKGSKRKILKAIIVLPPALAFTQSFKVPYISEEKLDESAYLNLRMISPIEGDKSYMGWQKIQEANEQYELLGAFIEKKPVDDIKTALEEAFFYSVAFEFPALSLARLFIATSGKTPHVTLMIDVGSEGITFLIVVKGTLYFSSFISWEGMQKKDGAEGGITEQMFEEKLILEVGKVANFALSRLKRTIDKILFIAPGMETRIADILKESEATVTPFQTQTPTLSSQWYTAWGAAMRSAVESEKNKYINLGTQEATTIFFREKVSGFVILWRNILIATLGVLLITNGGAATFVVRELRAVQANTPSTVIGLEELAMLEEKAQEFNGIIWRIKAVKRERINWHRTLTDVTEITNTNSISITQLGIGTGANAQLSGKAPSNNAIIAFKNAMEEHPEFSNVDVPLSRITQEGNIVGFTMSFTFNPERVFE
jgi:Tfp pilus assembly PilM family ATPase